MGLNALVVDDESLARETIRRLLAADPEIDQVTDCCSGAEAARRIRQAPPDILFLDVQMPEVDGFEVLRRAQPAEVPAIIFVTGHDAFAIKAFENEALDYLLKPFDDERFRRAVARAKLRVKAHRVNHLARRMAAALEPASGAPPERPTRYLERLGIRRENSGGVGGIFFLRVEEVDWIEAADYCVRVHSGGRFHLLREPLRDLETRLDPGRFFRVHRSAIVNLARIRELHRHFHGDGVVIMQDGSRLRVSRARRERLHQLLGLG